MKIKNILKSILPYGMIASPIFYPTINIFNSFRTKFKYFSARENSVIIMEFDFVHAETIPGLTKYILDLGYNVDIVIRKPCKRSGRNDLGIFHFFENNDKVRVMILSGFNLNFLLRSSIAKTYKHIIINSFYDTMKLHHLYKIDLFKLKPICMIHNQNYQNDYLNTNKIISLVKIESINRKTPFIVNSHYFGNYNKKKEKSETTIFVTLNTKDLFRRNLFLLFDACDKLCEKGITNFNIKIIGNGIPIPKQFEKHFQNFGFLDFQSMYKELAISDFFLALIDSASIQYTNKASGTYQISYGFLKPLVLHKKFSEVSGLNDTNSILYNTNGYLANAMERCIKMSNSEYKSILASLESTENELYNFSLKNFKKALDSPI